MLICCWRLRGSLFQVATAQLALAACAALASAQQSTEWQLNAPYRCPDGVTYAITKKTGSGDREICFWREEQNGRLVTEAYSQCIYMTGRLAPCKVDTALQAQPAAQPATQKEDWRSRPTNPAYLTAMPYVETVKSTIKGTSPDDALARQLTIFTYIPEMIGRMREAGRPYGSPWTPDETQIVYAYNVAAKKILDDYSKTHTPQQTAQLQQREGHYELMDDQFYKQWTKALFPADFLEAYNKAAWGLLTQYKAHVEQEKKQNEEAVARAKAAQQSAAQGGQGGLYQDAGSVAARRCLELGGSALECVGKGMTTGLFDLAGMNPAAALSSSYTGLTLTGNFTSPNAMSARFGDTRVSLGGCGSLIINGRAYRLERKGSQVLVHVQNSPAPFTLVLEPDGKLEGPTSVQVAGKVVTGYRRYWVQTQSHFTRYGNFVQGTGHEEREPIYAGKTQTCTIGALAPTGPSATVGVLSGLSDWLSGPSSGSAKNAENDLPGPGIRMAGVYTSQGGLKAEFATGTVDR